jgi:hypothetical protein
MLDKTCWQNSTLPVRISRSRGEEYLYSEVRRKTALFWFVKRTEWPEMPENRAKRKNVPCERLKLRISKKSKGERK